LAWQLCINGNHPNKKNNKNNKKKLLENFADKKTHHG